MWIVASLPLWFMGLVALLVGVYGLNRVATRPIEPRDGPELCFSVVCLIAAAVLLPIAAKVAS